MVLFKYFESRVSKALKTKCGHDRTVLLKDRTVLFKLVEIKCKIERQKCPLFDRSGVYVTEVSFFLFRKQNCPFQHNLWLEVSFSLQILGKFLTGLEL